MSKCVILATCVIALALTACGGPVPAATPVPAVTAGPAATGTAQPMPTVPSTGAPVAATPTAGATALAVPELKLLLLARYPDFFYCDPDQYPVARANEADLAVERFATIQADRETFAAIVHYLKLDGVTTFSAEQKLVIYQLYKRMNAALLQPEGGAYAFNIRLRPAGGGTQGTAVTGTISAQGAITETSRQSTITTCPICLVRGTRIDTPDGQIAVEDMHAGMRIWTAGANGERLAAIVMRAEHVDVPAMHAVVRVTLADGRMVTASPGHPTTDGRVLADLHAGDLLDGARVTAIESMAYDGGATFDVLPSGPTGAYWANGILLESTLR